MLFVYSQNCAIFIDHAWSSILSMSSDLNKRYNSVVAYHK